MVLHAPLATFTLDFENGTFLFVEEEKENSCGEHSFSFSFCYIPNLFVFAFPIIIYPDALWKHSRKRGVKSKPFLHDQSLPSYYADFAHLFTRRRYIELAMVGEYSLVRYLANTNIIKTF